MTTTNTMKNILTAPDTFGPCTCRNLLCSVLGFVGNFRILLYLALGFFVGVNLKTNVYISEYKYENLFVSTKSADTNNNATPINADANQSKESASNSVNNVKTKSLPFKSAPRKPVRYPMTPSAPIVLSESEINQYIRKKDEKEWKTGTLNRTMIELQLIAIREAGISLDTNKSLMEQNLIFGYPQLPTIGYRYCINTFFPSLSKNATKNVTYIGNNHQMMCPTCVPINIHNISTQSNFRIASEAICQSQLLLCDSESTYLCALLGLSVRTPVLVTNNNEYMEWPSYMKEYIITVSANNMNRSELSDIDSVVVAVQKEQTNSTILDNHRIFFNRHTIKQTNRVKMLQQHLGGDQMYASDIGFNAFLYSDPGLCKGKQRHEPLRHGNMGDTMGTFVADYFAAKLNMSYHYRCYLDHKTLTPPNAHSITFGFIGSLAGPTLKNVNPNAPRGSGRFINVILGMGVIDDEGSRITSQKVKNGRVLGVRGPLSRDIFLYKQGINPEVVSDPGLYFYPIFKQEIEKARDFANSSKLLDTVETISTNVTMQTKELCFISHEVENQWFIDNLSAYSSVTIRAGKLGHGGDMFEIIPFIATCEVIISSSLHGVIFGHALSIPSIPIAVTTLLAGGEFKFLDYYRGINVTSFTGRYSIAENGIPSTAKDWISLVHMYPQPEFPFQYQRLPVFDIIKFIYNKNNISLE